MFSHPEYIWTKSSSKTPLVESGADYQGERETEFRFVKYKTK